MTLYDSKPTRIDAEVFDGGYNSHDKLVAWMAEHGHAEHYRGLNLKSKPERREFTFAVAKNGMAVATISKGDAIVAEPDGTGFYPCVAEIFQARWTVALCEDCGQSVSPHEHFTDGFGNFIASIPMTPMVDSIPPVPAGYQHSVYGEIVCRVPRDLCVARAAVGMCCAD